MKTTPFLAAISLLFFSCEGDSEERINTLGSEVSFSMAEYLEPGENTLAFKFLTAKDFPCINYQIGYQVEKTGNQISVSLKEIEKADVCLDAYGPATAFVELGSLAEGDYSLVISVGEELVNEGILSVNPQAYRLTLEEPQGLLIEDTQLLRVPEQVIWGTVRYGSTQQSEAIYHALMSSLRGVGASEIRLSEGNYHYFDIDASGRIIPKNIGADMAEEAFMMEFGGDASQIADVLSRMQQTYGEEVMARIYNARGEEFKTLHF